MYMIYLFISTFGIYLLYLLDYNAIVVLFCYAFYKSAQKVMTKLNRDRDLGSGPPLQQSVVAHLMFNCKLILITLHSSLLLWKGLFGHKICFFIFSLLIDFQKLAFNTQRGPVHFKNHNFLLFELYIPISLIPF